VKTPNEARPLGTGAPHFFFYFGANRKRGMGEIEDKEVENLGRALASHHGRRWTTMPREGQREADPNGTRKSWLRRARVVLEAVHHAMIVQMKRE
jgi:hypothetical protein